MEKKWWLESQTIKGAIKGFVPLIFTILTLAGIQITSTEQANITDAIVTLAITVISLWGIVDVIIGRFKADKPLTMKK